jgi:hypothetical protein
MMPRKDSDYLSVGGNYRRLEVHRGRYHDAFEPRWSGD